MAKEFNITGRCFPNEHYMADVSEQLNQTLNLIKQGAYFVINRPRQYGKTTTLITLARLLRETDDYVAFNISFEGIGDSPFESAESFSPIFVRQLADSAKRNALPIANWIAEQIPLVKSLYDLSDFITALVNEIGKKTVITIDEVDKSSNNQLFISFLAMLRDKYLIRDEARTFHSIVLAGVHDVKSLKLKLRPDEEAKLNSPWNIATEYKVDLNLKPYQIKPMLEEYAADKNVTMDTEGVAERLFYWTSGYPFLVSKLCKMMDEEVLPTKLAHPKADGTERTWTVGDIDTTVFKMTKETNTNFENVIKNLENNPELYNVTSLLLFEGTYFSYNVHDPLVNLGIIHGIFKNGHGIKIHNRVYEELIYDYMVSRTKTKMQLNGKDIKALYQPVNQRLDLTVVLSKFQDFMKEQYSKHDLEFIERNGRLIFLAFLRPIINGSGYDFKEVQISEERRLDVVITYFENRYVVEMKMWYGDAAHKKGVKQLTDYLDKQNLNEGYLIVFDTRETKTWKKGWTRPRDKRVYMVWV